MKQKMPKNCPLLKAFLKTLTREHEQGFHPVFVVSLKTDHIEGDPENEMIEFSVMVDPGAEDLEEIKQLHEYADSIFDLQKVEPKPESKPS